MQSLVVHNNKPIIISSRRKLPLLAVVDSLPCCATLSSNTICSSSSCKFRGFFFFNFFYMLYWNGLKLFSLERNWLGGFWVLDGLEFKTLINLGYWTRGAFDGLSLSGLEEFRVYGHSLAELPWTQLFHLCRKC